MMEDRIKTMKSKTFSMRLKKSGSILESTKPVRLSETEDKIVIGTRSGLFGDKTCIPIEEIEELKEDVEQRTIHDGANKTLTEEKWISALVESQKKSCWGRRYQASKTYKLKAENLADHATWLQGLTDLRYRSQRKKKIYKEADWIDDLFIQADLDKSGQ